MYPSWWDAVVFKLNNTGTALQWSNFYGSTSDDAGYSVKVRGSNVYICGGTEGGNLPSTTGAYKTSKLGTLEDGFVARFNALTGALRSICGHFRLRPNVLVRRR